MTYTTTLAGKKKPQKLQISFLAYCKIALSTLPYSLLPIRYYLIKRLSAFAANNSY